VKLLAVLGIEDSYHDSMITRTQGDAVTARIVTHCGWERDSVIPTAILGNCVFVEASTHYGYSFRPYYYAVTRRTALLVLQGT